MPVLAGAGHHSGTSTATAPFTTPNSSPAPSAQGTGVLCPASASQTHIQPSVRMLLHLFTQQGCRIASLPTNLPGAMKFAGGSHSACGHKHRPLAPGALLPWDGRRNNTSPGTRPLPAGTHPPCRARSKHAAPRRDPEQEQGAGCPLHPRGCPDPESVATPWCETPAGLAGTGSRAGRGKERGQELAGPRPPPRTGAGPQSRRAARLPPSGPRAGTRQPPPPPGPRHRPHASGLPAGTGVAPLPLPAPRHPPPALLRGATHQPRGVHRPQAGSALSSVASQAGTVPRDIALCRGVEMPTVLSPLLQGASKPPSVVVKGCLGPEGNSGDVGGKGELHRPQRRETAPLTT